MGKSKEYYTEESGSVAIVEDNGIIMFKTLDSNAWIRYGWKSRDFFENNNLTKVNKKKFKLMGIPLYEE